MMTSTIARCAGVVLLVAGGTALSVAPAAAGPAGGGDPAGVAPLADVNGDGFADQLISAPLGSFHGQSQAGYVAVADGSADGTIVDHRPVLSRATEGVPGDPAANERWGERSVARDLDGDGFTDLAVGGRSADVPTLLWGSSDGLKGGTALPAELGTAGSNLVGGDFNGDGNADLIADNSDRGEHEGDLRVLYGPFDRSGQPAGTGDLHTDKIFAPTDLVAGDVTGDGADDLVSMHAFEEMSQASLFWKGSAGGVVDDPSSLPDAAAGTVGDVDGDGTGDLVLRTVPGGVVENLPYDHGTLKVLYGTADGPGDRTTTIDQNTSGVPGVNEEGDQFGHALSAGDVNGDGYADIAVGVPYEDLANSQRDTGAVVLLKGSGSGLSGSGAQAFHQATSGVPGIAEAGDRFGSAVSLQDTDGDDRSDLAVGTPGEDSTDLSDTGAVWVLRGSGSGLVTDGVVSFGPAQIGGWPDGARLGSGFAK